MAGPIPELHNTIVLLPAGTSVPDGIEVGRFLVGSTAFDTITAEEYNRIHKPEWSLVETEYYGVLLAKTPRMRMPAKDSTPPVVSTTSNTDEKCTVTKTIHRGIGETVDDVLVAPTLAVFEPFWHGRVVLSCPHSYSIIPPKDKNTLHILIWSSPQQVGCTRVPCPQYLWGNKVVVRDALSTETTLGGFILKHKGYIVAHLLVNDESCALYIMHDMNHKIDCNSEASTLATYERILRWAASHLGGPTYSTSESIESVVTGVYSTQITERIGIHKRTFYEETQRYDEYSRALIATSRKIQELEHERVLLEQLSSNVQQRCDDTIIELTKLPEVERVYINADTSLCIALKPIEVAHEDSKFVISGIEIHIDGYTGDVQFTGPKIGGVSLPNVDQYGYPQSHEFAISACQLIGSCELVTLAQMCINHVRSGGPLIVNWPKAE